MFYITIYILRLFVVKYKKTKYRAARIRTGRGANTGKGACPMKKFTTAVILAAGSGNRFGGAVKKQYAELCGVPCIVRTLRAFEIAQSIDEIILVGDVEALHDTVDGEGFKKLAKIVEGGETRQRSALHGFDAVSPKSKYVAFHDGARCLVTPDIIDRTVEAAYKYRAATAAHACTDTVKSSDPKDFVKRTLDRNEIWLSQSPQVFETDLYRVSAYMAVRDGATATDDCMLAERLGFDVKLVECGSMNLKLTLPEDKDIFEAIIRSREQSGGGQS